MSNFVFNSGYGVDLSVPLATVVEAFANDGSIVDNDGAYERIWGRFPRAELANCKQRVRNFMFHAAR